MTIKKTYPSYYFEEANKACRKDGDSLTVWCVQMNSTFEIKNKWLCLYRYFVNGKPAGYHSLLFTTAIMV